MQPIIYDVAVSIDGYICGPGGDISTFAQEGPVVEDYMARLATYATAVMGRRTYEFGYRFGLQPGRNPYSHMKTYIFSRSMDLPDNGEVTVLRTGNTQWICDLKSSSDGPIYLCGGGAFAGSLLSMGLIDRIRLKRAPVILGGGVRLFGDAAASPGLQHIETREYADGYMFQEFSVQT